MLGHQVSLDTFHVDFMRRIKGIQERLKEIPLSKVFDLGVLWN